MSFVTLDELRDFRKRIAMDGYPPGKVWLCDATLMWHYEGAAPDPAGHSSGTTRTAKHKS